MNKYKNLAFNTIVFAIGSFGSKILSFLLTRLYTGSLNGAGEFNTKEVLELFANLLIPVVSFSITEALIRYGLDKNYDPASVFSNALVILGCGAGIFLLFSPLLLLYPDIRTYVPLLVGYIIISCFRQISTQFARVRGKVKLYALDGILCTLTLFIFNIIFIKWMGLGVTGFMLSVMLSDFCSGVFVWLVAKHTPFFSLKNVDSDLLMVMLRFSLPLIPTAILWLITGFSDRLFIRHMKSDVDAGVYGAATKIPNLISMASTVFYQAWNMSAIAENDSEDRSKFYTQIFDAYQAMLTLAAGFIIALDIPLSAILINTSKDAAYTKAYLYTPVLVIAVLLMCYNQFLSSIYTVSKHTKNSFWTSLIAAVLNLAMNLLLIPKYGVYGAISATFASYFICYIIRIVDARRYIPFQVSHWKFCLNLLFLFTLSGLIQMKVQMLQIWLCVVLALLIVFNIKPLMSTAKKFLHRH